MKTMALYNQLLCSKDKNAVIKALREFKKHNSFDTNFEKRSKNGAHKKIN